MGPEKTGVLARLRSAAGAMKREVAAYRLVLKDPRTPAAAKVLLGVAVGYALLPIDLVPDFLPVVGHLDDLVIVGGLVLLARRMIPPEVVADCRARVVRDASRPCSAKQHCSAK